MQSSQTCPECGAALDGGVTCEEHFYQMLYWENEYPEVGVVHHLMVLSYYLQHPSLYSPEGVKTGMKLLTDFLDREISTEAVRREQRERVDSGNRAWKIKGTPGNEGSYQHPVHWKMTAKDATAGGAERYVESVRAWAQSILDELKASGNLQRG